MNEQHRKNGGVGRTAAPTRHGVGRTAAPTRHGAGRRPGWRRLALAAVALILLACLARCWVPLKVPAEPPGPPAERIAGIQARAPGDQVLPASGGREAASAAGAPLGQISLAAAEVPNGSEDWPALIQGLATERRKSPADEGLRSRLAEAHHGYGIAFAQRSRWEPAAANVESAVRLVPGEPRYRKSLSRILLAWAVDDRNRAREGAASSHGEEVKRRIDRAAEVDPECAEAFLVLGDVEYENQRLDEARRAWLKAKGLQPGLEGLRERLERLGREYTAEVGMKSAHGYDFIVRYEEAVSSALGFDVAESLREAKRAVGQVFDYWPERRIVVLVYTMETYRRVAAGAPEWSAGLYDGKIRIPVPDSSADIRHVQAIIWHEYTHAVVHDLGGGRCPLWLNEGLAEFQSARFSGRDALGAVRQLAGEGRLVPWKSLDGRFRSASAGAAAQAYDEAHSVVAYLAETYGFWRMPKLLKALASGADFAAAVGQHFQLSSDQLERNWRAWAGAPG
ncbi:MAG: hypothetical protein HY900_28455 [Deltaproteobacteria bacterium]|nr:hypothetical protein [Deltaproteobacteria bacterium]